MSMFLMNDKRKISVLLPLRIAWTSNQHRMPANYPILVAWRDMHGLIIAMPPVVHAPLRDFPFRPPLRPPRVSHGKPHLRLISEWANSIEVAPLTRITIRDIVVCTTHTFLPFTRFAFDHANHSSWSHREQGSLGICLALHRQHDTRACLAAPRLSRYSRKSSPNSLIPRSFRVRV